MKFKNYLHLFKEAAPSKHKIIAEGRVSNIYSETGIKSILKKNPNSKFIVMLRNPKEACLSLFLQTYKKDNKKDHNFEEEWQNIKQGKQFHWGNIFYRNAYKYNMHIDSLYSITKFKNVHFIFFEDFKKSNISTFKNLCQFLEIDDNFIPLFKHVNPRSIEKNLVLAKTYNYLSKYTHNIRQHLNLTDLNKKTKKIRKKLGLTNILVTTDPKSIEKAAWHSEKTKQEMLDWFTPDIQKLEKLLDKDLSHWKV